MGRNYKSFRTDRRTFKFDMKKSKINRCIGEKDLIPWDDSDSEIEHTLDVKQKGWDVIEMFNENEKKYGVKSNYDPELKSYTLPLQKKNTKDYKTALAHAAKLAQEIESTTVHKARISLEINEDNEETKLEK